ncbi:unnamed protein product [Rhodiola kirilowii]
MLQQKIVLEVYMPCDKCKKKARKIVASSEGMISMAIEGEKNQLVVVGVGMDAAILATSLRKKVGRTTILSVEEVKSEDKKKEEEEAKKKKEAEEAKKKKNEEEQAKTNRNVPWSYNNCYDYAPPLPSYPGYDVCYGAPSYPNSWFSW